MTRSADSTPGTGFLAPLWRGVDVFRTASLVYVVVLFAQQADEYRRPIGGWLVVAAMAGWTAYLWVRRTRPAWLNVADLAASCGAVLVTRLVDTEERIEGGAQTLAVIWPASSVLAFAVWKGWRGGLAAAAVVAVADLIEVQRPTAGTIHNIVLLILAGAIVGYCADLYRGSREALSRALRMEASTRERERLARDIHDSVLQVLAYVQRRGAEIGGEAAELGRLAGDQQDLLRSLVSSRVADGGDGSVDLRRLMAPYARRGVHLATPAEPVLLSAEVADELAAAVGAALDNVSRHAGPGAQAWVLVEDEGDDVLVTVRDDGVGIPDGRLEEARGDGRLGVASSVQGRVLELGGTATVVSAPGAGTEVELRVPRKVRS
jgi:signal transduction histidine kinase